MKMHNATCRFCGSPLTGSLVDLGRSPLANSYLLARDLTQPEPMYPLHAKICPQCFLVQLEMFASPKKIFSEYAYFSSYSQTWLRHAEAYAKQTISDLGLESDSFVVEVAGNDGYLLKHFAASGIPCLNVEPAANVAKAGEALGVPCLCEFFGEALGEKIALERGKANLMVANNVMAHVPDVNDFAAGFRELLKPNGVASLEFPHLLRLLESVQFDTIYHEHFSYLSFTVAEKIFARQGLAVFDVQELPTHGGSLRLWVSHAGNSERPVSGAVSALRKREHDIGLTSMEGYVGFAQRVSQVRRDLCSFLTEAQQAGKMVAAYGAAAKGNTLLNYCGTTSKMIQLVADVSPHKQGLFLPGSHIPIVSPEHLLRAKPDYVLILPWNIKDEIMRQMSGIKVWGGRFVTAVPRLTIHEPSQVVAQ